MIVVLLVIFCPVWWVVIAGLWGSKETSKVLWNKGTNVRSNPQDKNKIIKTINRILWNHNNLPYVRVSLPRCEAVRTGLRRPSTPSTAVVGWNSQVSVTYPGLPFPPTSVCSARSTKWRSNHLRCSNHLISNSHQRQVVGNCPLETKIQSFLRAVYSNRISIKNGRGLSKRSCPAWCAHEGAAFWGR